MILRERIFGIITKTIITFFGTDDYKDIKKKSLAIAASFFSLKVIDYILCGLSLAIVILLKNMSFTLFGIFIILWLINIVIGGIIIIVHNYTGVDITTMQGRGRWIKALYKNSNFLLGKFLCVIFDILYCIFIIIWEGAEYFIIFIKERLPTRLSIPAIFFMASALHVFVWTNIYFFGYDGVSKLVKHYIH